MADKLVAFPQYGAAGGQTIPILAVDNGAEASFSLDTTATLVGGGDATAANQTLQITQETATNTLLGTTGIKVLKQQGAANLASSQVTSTAAAATLVIARPTRRSVLIRNLDTANSVWVGPATVTTGNGMQIKAGESCPFTWVGLIQVIDNGSHAAVGIADEYDT